MEKRFEKQLIFVYTNLVICKFLIVNMIFFVNYIKKNSFQLFGSAIRIEFAKSNKFPDDSKFQKKPLNLPLLPLQPSLLPMKIPLLGPPMPLATPSNHLLTSPPSRPLLDSKPREFHHPHPNRQFSHHSPFKRRRSISPDRQFSGRYSRSPPRRRYS